MAASGFTAALPSFLFTQSVLGSHCQNHLTRSGLLNPCLCTFSSLKANHVASLGNCKRLTRISRLSGRRKDFHVRSALPDDAEEASTSGSGDDDSPTAAEIDWREFRARLVARSAAEAAERAREEQLESDAAEDRAVPEIQPGGSWAHPLVLPEVGALVIAKPGYFNQNQQYFNHAVILLLHHGEEGSMGIILNKPTEHTLGTLFEGIDTLSPELASGRLYLGGDVGHGATHVLHRHSDLDGTRKVVEGVYTGGFEAIGEHIRAGKSECDDYRWFHMYAGWGPGQLENEVKAGVWFLGSCSRDLLLTHSEDLKTPLWDEVLQLMGGTYAEVAKRRAEDMP